VVEVLGAEIAAGRIFILSTLSKLPWLGWVSLMAGSSNGAACSVALSCRGRQGRCSTVWVTP